MKDKTRVLIYPYSVEFSPVLRHRRLMHSYDIAGVVSPLGFGLSGKDAGYADNGSDIGMIVDDNIADHIDSFDALMVVDSVSQLNFEKIIMPKINMAINAGKDIVCLAKIRQAVSDEIEHACRIKGVTYKKLYEHEESRTFQNVELERISEIETPVLLIAGLAECTRKFEIQLSVREKLLEKGYAISQIGTRPYSGIFGMHPFPEFMYSNSISEASKVVLFNLFVKELETREKPDLIVIGVPGGVMPFSNQFTNRFGILAFEVCQAVTPDAAIISALYENFVARFFEMMSTSLKYKLGFQPDCFNLANIQLDWAGSKESNQLKYIQLKSGFIDEKKANMQTTDAPIFNVMNDRDSFDMVEFILDRLSPYGNTEVV